MTTRPKSGAARTDAKPGLPGRGFRVLVVDDAEGIRTYLANLLELSGYDVDTADDGRRALALLDGGADPDVIILDVMMPGFDGIETLRKIHERHSDIPVIMLSGQATVDMAVGARPERLSSHIRE